MKHRQPVKKHKRRGKHTFEDKWNFKKSFKKDYYDKKEFKKLKREEKIF